MTAIQQHDKELRERGYKFLGWMNGWVTVPQECKHCRENHHSQKTIDDYQTCDHTISCDVCKIFWKYDSGD